MALLKPSRKFKTALESLVNNRSPIEESDDDGDPGDVREKLREIREDIEVDTFVKELTEKAELEKTFSHVWDIYGVVDRTLSEAARLEDIDQTSIELNRARSRAESRLNHVARLPVYLYLIELQDSGKRAAAVRAAVGTSLGATLATMLDVEFGAHHAALVIGDVVIEWDESSLVAPTQRELLPVFRANMQRHHSHWLSCVKEAHTKMFATVTAETVSYGEQIDSMVDLNEMKKALIDRLIDVIITYNKYHYYHPFLRNCQHFVLDALKALGITEPPTFTGRMEEYYKALCKSRRPGLPKEFTTHEDLDSYIKKNHQSLQLDDLEYFLCRYYRFHRSEAATKEASTEEVERRAEALTKEGDRAQCSRPTCQMRALDERITKGTVRLLLEDYRRT